jgi:hypothetical protein
MSLRSLERVERLLGESEEKLQLMVDAGAWSRWMRAKRFMASIGELTRAAQYLAQVGAPGVSPGHLHAIGVQVDAMIERLEAFLSETAARRPGDLSRYRRLVERIYELRSDFECISRGVIARPGFIDVRQADLYLRAHPELPAGRH